jgi:hypothetical protein
MRTFLIANHDNHHYISDVAAGLWMISCMGFRGKGLKIVLDRSFPTLGMGWMSQTNMGRGGVPGIFRLDLGETARRSNNRKNPFLFPDTMLKLLHGATSNTKNSRERLS